MLIFVYGSLKRGFHNHSIISDGVFISEHTTTPTFTLYDLGAYPAVTQGGSTSIKGELWEVANLDRTDWLEGYPSYYNRILIPTWSGAAWIYTLPEAPINKAEVVSGIWT